MTSCKFLQCVKNYVSLLSGSVSQMLNEPVKSLMSRGFSVAHLAQQAPETAIFHVCKFLHDTPSL